MEYIFLSGEVGWEITPTILADKFNELKEKEVTIYVNTIGGYAYDGIAIYDFLKLKQSQGYKITTVATGITASAGTFIYLAGNKDSRKIHNTTSFLIHEAWAFGGGNIDDFEKQKSELVELNNKLAEIYEAETNLTKAEALEVMKEDKMADSDWLVEKGFASEIIKYEAVAKLERETIKNQNTMTDIKLSKDDKNWLQNQFDKFAKLFGRNPQAKVIQDANGDEIDFYELENDAEPKVGDKAKVDDKDANGEYVIVKDEKSYTYKFENGELKEIVENVENNDTELEQLKAENEQLKQKIAELESAQAKLQNIENEFTQFKAELKSKFNYDKKDEKNGNPQNNNGIRQRKVFN